MREEMIRACLADMREALRNATPQTQVDADYRMGFLSERMATLTMEMSLPEIMALSASVISTSEKSYGGIGPATKVMSSQID